MYRLRATPTYLKERDCLLKRNPRLGKRLELALGKLSQDPKQVSLRSHKVNTPLDGLRWSSWVTGDFRLIWDYDSQQHLVLILIHLGGHSGKHKVYQ